MIYKSYYLNATDYLNVNIKPGIEKMVPFLLGGIFTGGNIVIDFEDVTKNIDLDDFLNPEWFGD